MHFADRNTRITASAIRELFDKARHIPDAIDLSIGQGDFEVPEPIKQAAARALENPSCGRYSATEGYAELVAATTGYLQRTFGLPADEPVMLTAGATGALTLAMLALVDRGDEVLLPDPHFVAYRNIVHIAGGQPVFYDLYPDFRLRAARIAERLTPRTRLVVLNGPANPTGAVWSADELSEVCRLCDERGVPILSDELYALFSFDAPHVSVKHFAGPECLLVGGFSKTYAMAGWRLGWAAGPAELIDKMRTLQQFTYACPSTLTQHAALAAFEVDMRPQIAAYRAKRDLMHRGLVEAGYDVVRPGGSFFLFPKVPWGDDQAFCEDALSRKLIIVPGRAFSQRSTHFRLTYASDETLERGLEVLRGMAAAPRAVTAVSSSASR